MDNREENRVHVIVIKQPWLEDIFGQPVPPKVVLNRQGIDGLLTIITTADRVIDGDRLIFAGTVSGKIGEKDKTYDQQIVYGQQISNGKLQWRLNVGDIQLTGLCLHDNCMVLPPDTRPQIALNILESREQI